MIETQRRVRLRRSNSFSHRAKPHRHEQVPVSIRKQRRQQVSGPPRVIATETAIEDVGAAGE
eukprot:2983874-Prymnesium_polylepis.1